MLVKGVRADLTNDKCEKPLHMAIRKGNQDIVKLLVKDVSSKDKILSRKRRNEKDKRSDLVKMIERTEGSQAVNEYTENLDTQRIERSRLWKKEFRTTAMLQNSYGDIEKAIVDR